MSYSRKTAVLQFWHAQLNRMFFSGKLEPAVVSILSEEKSENNDDTEALFLGMLDPFVIEFTRGVLEGENLLPDSESGPFPEYTLTVLLHEMVHQYCAEHDIEDINESGKHSAKFVKAAEAHGLTNDGYKLKEDALQAIRDRWEHVAYITAYCTRQEGE